MTSPVDAVVEKPPRRFPPPCWTQEETLALIDTYRERWYELRRGYLRTPDWDEVADAVGSRCPGALPAKTSAQCRHKMEKLRQRYRAEKQRALSVPSPGGRYFSSWFFFENMEAMENGAVPPASIRSADNSTDGSRLKSVLDPNLLKLKLKADSVPESGFDQNLVKIRRFTIPGAYQPPYLNKEEQQQQEEAPQLKSKVKKSTTTLKNHDIRHEFHQCDALAPGLTPKSLRNLGPNTESDYQQQFWVKYSNRNISSNSTALQLGSKRGRSGVEEMVASIKALGECLMKMEKAKMDLAREMEEMRMEMEMKRNQVLLESQKEIVEAFLKGLLDLKSGKKLKSGEDHRP